MQEAIKIHKAREHNLREVSVTLPRHRLITLTGVSGSGKSSLAFDTLYAEGRYRYMQSFSAYARTFMGELKRPDVEKIEGIAPVISIEQKTTQHNPRSTVGTLTEIYDFLRVLYAKISDAYSYLTHEKMAKQSAKEIAEGIFRRFAGKRVQLLSPVVRERKGHHRELFERLRKRGFTRVRVDGVIKTLLPNMKLARYKAHSIELLTDSFSVADNEKEQQRASIQLALAEGDGVLMLLEEGKKPYYFSETLTDPVSGLSYEEPTPAHFSFNSKLGACTHCKGLGVVEEIDLESVIPDPSLSIAAGGLPAIGKERKVFYFDRIGEILSSHGASLHTPIEALPAHALQRVLYGNLPQEEEERRSLLEALKGGEHVRYVDLIDEFGVIGMITYASAGRRNSFMRRLMEDHAITKTCPSCQGKRLKPTSLGFKVADKDIMEVAALPLRSFEAWIDELGKNLTGRRKKIAADLLKEVKDRTRLINNLGLDYLSLNRPLKSLSGGESQRIRLATQIGSELMDVIYILDEPSIGLHPRDNHRLIASLKRLRDMGNTVVVMEHDREMIENSDHIVDMGVGAGKQGGMVVFSGDLSHLVRNKGLTAQYISNQKLIKVPEKRRKGNGKWLTLHGASGHNLKGAQLAIPLGTLTAMTGVSGSGKSTLLMETLVVALRKAYHKAHQRPLPFASIEGLEHLNKIIKIDQSPIGRTPRSNPATYTGVFTDIRNLFSSCPESKIRGYKAGHFSFNVKGGRCADCEGRGATIVEMGLLPDVEAPCTRCMGRRFSAQTLEVRYKGKSIADVLDMPITRAVTFFSDYPSIRKKLEAIQQVGLGYITLGQPAPTLSGGEAQRMKLSSELLKKDTGCTLYVLDEPTTGLHFEDVEKLLSILHHLADKGNTVVVIEHHMDVIKVADHLIDMGPEGGEEGGEIVYAGTPEGLVASGKGHMASYLGEELQRCQRMPSKVTS